MPVKVEGEMGMFGVPKFIEDSLRDSVIPMQIGFAVGHPDNCHRFGMSLKAKIDEGYMRLGSPYMSGRTKMQVMVKPVE